MHTIKEKVSNAAAAAQEHIDVMKAKAEESAAKAVATTKEERKIAEERRKVKEAEAEMKLHQIHAENAEEKLRHKQTHHLFGHRNPLHGPSHQQGVYHEQPVGTVLPTTTTTAGAGVTEPNYPIAGNPPTHHTHKHL